MRALVLLALLLTDQPFDTQGKAAAIVFFITTDCPISNNYATEIRGICEKYEKNARCTLIYTDPTLTNAQVLKHARDYGHGSYPAIIDPNHDFVKAAGATVTPEAAVFLPNGHLAYRGRIDDKNLALGVIRPKATGFDLRDAMDAIVAGRPVATPRTTAIGCFITPAEWFKGKAK
jgi:hypothetical protein